MVSREVTVTKFRYLEEIKSKENVFYNRSEIRGKFQIDCEIILAKYYQSYYPPVVYTTALKNKTIEIIKASEGYHRLL